MTGTAPRIRWNDGLSGQVGAMGPFAFFIVRVYAREKWMLTAELPGLGRKNARSDDLDELKCAAERWLEECITSLGAVFPEMIAARLSAFVHRVEALEDSDQAAGALTDLAHMGLADGIGEADRVAFREIILARFPDAED